MPRSFSVDEANRMLPLVKRIVSDAVRDYWRWQDTVREFEVAALRSSPEQPDQAAEELQAKATKLAEEIDGYITELQKLGVLFKGFDTGLVDFPGKSMAGPYFYAGSSAKKVYSTGTRKVPDSLGDNHCPSSR